MAVESSSDPPIDFLIITSLDEEFQALIKALPVSTSSVSDLEGVARAHTCDFPVTLSNAPTSYRLVIVQQSGVGRVSAAVVASSAISRLRPHYVLLVGLAGGVGKKLHLGDILVADQIVDYEHQKLLSEKSAPSWQVYRPDPTLLRGVNEFAHTKWPRLIKAKRPVRGTIKVHVGPIASGDKIFSSGDETTNLLTRIVDQWPRLNGIEMEGSGVAAAVNNAATPTSFLMIRAVADMVGDVKNSDTHEWRNYAISAVAAFTVGFLASVPVQPLREINVPGQPSVLSETSSDVPGSGESGSEESIDPDGYLGHLGPLEHPRLAAYNSDNTDGPDLLSIRADVNAFASLIAAQTTSPPLSIGVFGEWGYGKSFFMRYIKNRVTEIASDARASGRLQKDVAFYKRIVQIEFNAWHYVEGNLWASLVEHILFNLRLSDSSQDEVQVLQTKLLSELGVKTLAKTEIESKVEDAKAKLEAIERSIDAKNQELDETAKKLQTLSATNIIAAVLSLPETRTEIDKLNVLRSDLGLPAVGAGLDDMRTAIAEAEAVVSRGTALLMPIVSAPDRKRRLIWLCLLLLGAPVIGIVTGWLLAFRGSQWIAQVGATLVTLTTWIYVIIGVLRRATVWVGDKVSKVERVKQHWEARVELAKVNVNDQIAKLQEEREDLRASYLKQIQQLAAAQESVEKLENELRQATPLHLLAKLIQDRTDSNDYRKHLGLLALVRRDFERISKFIEAENERLATLQRIEDEEDAIESRINRIVLYIDDLDRCPTEKVVQVLEAVHLLLAFPLFVVVVAVDARWVSGALREQYGQLLGAPPTLNQPGGQPSSHYDSATPLDYLEKIFQIPFWLSPLNRAARRNLLNGLIGSPVSKAESVNERTSIAEGDHTARNIAANVSPVANSPESEGVTIEAADTTGTDLNPEGLIIRPGELAFIDEMVPLLGRSPRALKRFVNIFRLIKSSVREADDSEAKVRMTDLEPDLKIAMFFLAVVTNSPDLSKEFFGSLYQATQKRKGSSKLTKDAWEKLLTPKDTGKQAQWSQIRTFLSQDAAKPIREATVRRLAWWARRVSRFSFYGDASTLEWTQSN